MQLVPACAYDSGAVVLFDFESFSSWANVCSLDLTQSEAAGQLTKTYQELLAIVAPEVSGVILSPQFGFDLLYSKPDPCGVVFGLDQVPPSPTKTTVPLLSTQWTQEHIRHNYGVSKLRLEYDPSAHDAYDKQQMILELYEYAQYIGIHFLIDLSTPQLEDAESPLVEALKHIRQSCHGVMVNSLDSALTAATVTAQLDNLWLARLPQSEYQQQKEYVRMVMENGATGIVIGPHSFDAGLLTLEAPSNETLDPHAVLNNKTSEHIRDRVLELTRLVQEGFLQTSPAR
ncbi:MAG: hypothetical protein H6774_00215 [Pseudomonadales bacterium]|nr:hypothetical protein [Pseudomonadales bacterium]